MKLSQKMKHIKRHRKNKRFAKFADSFHSAAAGCFINGDETMFIVSSRLYNLMNIIKGYVPENVKSFAFNRDDEIITVPRDITEFYNDNKLNYINEWCGIFHKELDEKTKEEVSKLPFSMFTNPELYMHIDKPIAPAIYTLNGVRV